MDDLDVLARDFGFGNREKANPMKPASTDRRPVDSSFSDVFGGQPKYTTTSNSRSAANQSLRRGFDYDSIFNSSAGSEFKNPSSSEKSSLPVFDKPIFDDDMFDGLPGLKRKPVTSSIRFDDDVFVSTTETAKSSNHDVGFNDLLGNLGRNNKAEEEKYTSSVKRNSSSQGFDDLLAGFGGQSSHANNRPTSESQWSSMPTFVTKKKNVLDDPFVGLETTSAPHSSSQMDADPLEDIDKFNKSRSVKSEVPSGGGGAFDDLDPLSTLGKSSRKDDLGNDGMQRSSSGYSENLGDNVPMDGFPESSFFDTAKDSTNVKKNVQTASSSHYGTGPKAEADTASTSGIGADQFEDAWLTVSEIPLFTQPSKAPPPSRPPPPIPRKGPVPDSGSFDSSSQNKGGIYPERSQSSKMPNMVDKGPPLSQFDELENFAMNKARSDLDENAHESDTSMYSAAAMKDAMDKAEAKFRHAKELRERESARGARNNESFPLEKDELDEEREFREKQEKLELERKQKEEIERKKLENEKRKEIEREKARQAVERATREARERAAAEARKKAERAAVEKANADARARAERVAVQRAQAEARERAALEAKERADKAAAEAKERAHKAERAAEAREKEERERAEARRRAERAAVEKATAEARDRAASAAREKAAATAQKSQEKNDNDLESFFSSGRASSAPKARTSPFDPFFYQQFPSKGVPETTRGAPSSGGTYSSKKKVSSSTNIVDDLSAIFGGAPSSGEFQEVEGETEDRRRARMERQQRTQERAAKALAEKNQRDIQAQKEQEERHRLAEVLDVEIKRWAAGKEGNLRALLSTLQYVLWPECGWQPVSLTDLITGASVKKVYRKATLFIHPDKVQQKGATLQQKYIAEKVFDLLKEAWNKFNSEELF